MEDMDDGRDSEQEAHHQDMLNRERAEVEALQRCADAGADLDALMVLASGLGLSNWKPNAHSRSASVG